MVRMPPGAYIEEISADIPDKGKHYSSLISRELNSC